MVVYLLSNNNFISHCSFRVKAGSSEVVTLEEFFQPCILLACQDIVIISDSLLFCCLPHHVRPPSSAIDSLCCFGISVPCYPQSSTTIDELYQKYFRSQLVAFDRIFFTLKGVKLLFGSCVRTRRGLKVKVSAVSDVVRMISVDVATSVLLLCLRNNLGTIFS